MHNLEEKELIKFLKSQGITVKTNTKARGNLGIYFNNRIDVSKNVAPQKRIPILIHEYAHKIHFDMEKEKFYEGGSLEVLFKKDKIEPYISELTDVTNFVDVNSNFDNINLKKQEIKNKIKELHEIIKQDFPLFKRSEDFKEAKTYFEKNKSIAVYFFKYDSVKVMNKLCNKVEVFNINNIDEDFFHIPEYLRAYIKLKSLQREYKRLIRYQNKAKNYYSKPAELFARFIEGMFINNTQVKLIAPNSYQRFFELLDNGYYGKLKELFALAGFVR